jgi:O-acetylserine/cysteine efflux transporter
MRVAAIAISFTGVVLIGFEPFGPAHLIALLMTAFASLMMAVATILMRQLQGVAVLNLQAWIALVATVSMGLVTLLLEPPYWETLRAIPVLEYWTALYSAVGATIAGHGLLYYLLQRYTINSVAPFITLSTLFAVGFGIVLLDDVLTVQIVIGGALTLLGVTIVAVRNARENAPSGIRAPR